MYEGAQYVDDNVEEMSSQKYYHGYGGTNRSRLHKHLGYGVDNHGDDARSQAQCKEPGVAQQVAHVTADIIQGKEPSHDLAYDTFLFTAAGEYDDGCPCDGQILAHRSRHKGHAEEAREHDQPADLVTESSQNVPVPDKHIGLQQHAADQVQGTEAEAEGQHLQGFLHGNKEQRVQLQSEPASEEGTPDNSRDAAEEDDHGQFAAESLGFHQFHGDKQPYGEDQAVACVRKHHAEEDKVERRHQEIRVDAARLRPGIQLDDRFIRPYEGIVFHFRRRNLPFFRIPELDLVGIRRAPYRPFHLGRAILPYPAFQTEGLFCFHAAVGQAFFLGRQLVVI